jgi:hypothetical protein
MEECEAEIVIWKLKVQSRRGKRWIPKQKKNLVTKKVNLESAANAHSENCYLETTTEYSVTGKVLAQFGI